MFRVLSHAQFLSRQFRLVKSQKELHLSRTSFAKPLTFVERQKCLELKTNSIATVFAVQNQTAPAVKMDHLEPMPIIDQSPVAGTVEDFPATEVKITIEEDSKVDKAPASFDEIPGPAILKLWEKYWKYVPLLGTQLFSSLLINRFYQGKLSWNRNVTPIKYLFNTYGSVVRINGPMMGDIIMIHRPEHIAEVFKQEESTPLRSSIDILEHYRLNHRKSRIAGPFSSQGAEWMQLRTVMEKPWSKIVSESFEKIEIVCDDFLARIRELRNRQDEVPANFHQNLVRWGFECFSEMTLNRRLGFLDLSGQDLTSDPARLISALTIAHKYMSFCETGFQVWRFMETPFSSKFFAACDVIDGVIGKYIRQARSKIRHRASPVTYNANYDDEDGSPFLEKFLLSQDVQPDDVSTLLMDTIIFGVPTVANCQGFLLYFLAKNPRVQKKLREEIESVSPDGSTLKVNNVRNLQYLQACLKETLRLRPAFPYITRLLSKDIVLHGYAVPKGTYVIMATQIASQREENFEDPEKFYPERWLSSKNSEEFCQNYSCLPFGHGLRSCMGKDIAETQIMMLTSKLVREFRIEYDYADIGCKFSMVNTPNKPLRFRFVDRD